VALSESRGGDGWKTGLKRGSPGGKGDRGILKKESDGDPVPSRIQKMTCIKGRNQLRGKAWVAAIDKPKRLGRLRSNRAQPKSKTDGHKHWAKFKHERSWGLKTKGPQGGANLRGIKGEGAWRPETPSGMYLVNRGQTLGPRGSPTVTWTRGAQPTKNIQGENRGQLTRK